LSRRSEVGPQMQQLARREEESFSKISQTFPRIGCLLFWRRPPPIFFALPTFSPQDYLFSNDFFIK
jgi:hypothetical protein